MCISDDFLNSALTSLFYLVKATETKNSLNQLTCTSIWWGLGDPTFIPLVMGLCALHSCKDIYIFPRQWRVLFIIIWLLYLSLPTLFPEEGITSPGKILPSYQWGCCFFFLHEWLSVISYLCTTSRNHFGANGLTIFFRSSAIPDAHHSQESSLLGAGTPRKLRKMWILSVVFKAVFDYDLKKSMKADVTVMHTLAFNFQ